MYYELTKRENKIAKAAIDKGVNTEFKAGLEKAEAIIATWHKDELDNSADYYKLFEAVEEQDKRIAQRYDGLSGSRYLFTVACILYDGQITDEDVKDFSEETKEQLNSWVAFFRQT